MTSFLARRLAAALLLLFLFLTATFFLLHAAPGEPGMIFEDPRVPAAHREQLRRLYGLDRPLLVQYGAWLRAVTLKGEWGSSILHHRPVTAVLAEALPNPLLLALAALAVEYFFGL